jgi:hypothetical protein
MVCQHSHDGEAIVRGEGGMLGIELGKRGDRDGVNDALYSCLVQPGHSRAMLPRAAKASMLWSVSVVCHAIPSAVAITGEPSADDRCREER